MLCSLSMNKGTLLGQIPSLFVLVLSLRADEPRPVPTTPSPTPQPTDFVEVIKTIPNIVIDLRYATAHNFFKKRLYGSDRCYLRRAVVEKLALVQKDLNQQGLGLKIWDGYRPLSVQWQLWKVVPDTRYVADPRQGSRHNRGAAIDATLIDLKTGQELPMPTGFDDFTPKAAADYPDVPAEALHHRRILHEAMKGQGFTPLSTEWWHFDAPGWEKYPVSDEPVK